MEIVALDKFWELINEKLEGWIEAGIKLLPNIMVAICSGQLNLATS